MTAKDFDAEFTAMVAGLAEDTEFQTGPFVRSENDTIRVDLPQWVRVVVASHARQLADHIAGIDPLGAAATAMVVHSDEQDQMSFALEHGPSMLEQRAAAFAALSGIDTAECVTTEIALQWCKSLNDLRFSVIAKLQQAPDEIGEALQELANLLGAVLSALLEAVED